MKKTLVEDGSVPGKSKLPNQTKTVSVTMDTEEMYEQIIAPFCSFPSLEDIALMDMIKHDINEFLYLIFKIVCLHIAALSKSLTFLFVRYFDHYYSPISYIDLIQYVSCLSLNE